ncbi:MAG: hypothetical protein N3D75_02165 [Candidatus Aenigmarchaeota archaeon]|nr:hypothetical protein [Candidatus Aenigmarchaeota archaeon]
MCQQIIGRVLTVEKDKAKVEIEGKIHLMKNPFVKIKKDDLVICAADYIIDKAEEDVVCNANKR